MEYLSIALSYASTLTFLYMMIRRNDRKPKEIDQVTDKKIEELTKHINHSYEDSLKAIRNKATRK